MNRFALDFMACLILLLASLLYVEAVQWHTTVRERMWFKLAAILVAALAAGLFAWGAS